MEEMREAAAGEDDGLLMKAVSSWAGLVVWTGGRLAWRAVMAAQGEEVERARTSRAWPAGCWPGLTRPPAAPLPRCPGTAVPPVPQSRSKLYSWKALRAVARTNLQAFAAVRGACSCGARP